MPEEPDENAEAADDRKDLLKKIGACRKIKDSLQEFQSDDYLKLAVTKAEKTVTAIVSLQSAAEVM